jgi:hypothetical protein
MLWVMNLHDRMFHLVTLIDIFRSGKLYGAVCSTCATVTGSAAPEGTIWRAQWLQYQQHKGSPLSAWPLHHSDPNRQTSLQTWTRGQVQNPYTHTSADACHWPSKWKCENSVHLVSESHFGLKWSNTLLSWPFVWHCITCYYNLVMSSSLNCRVQVNVKTYEKKLVI